MQLLYIWQCLFIIRFLKFLFYEYCDSFLGYYSNCRVSCKTNGKNLKTTIYSRSTSERGRCDTPSTGTDLYTRDRQSFKLAVGMDIRKLWVYFSFGNLEIQILRIFTKPFKNIFACLIKHNWICTLILFTFPSIYWYYKFVLQLITELNFIKFIKCFQYTIVWFQIFALQYSFVFFLSFYLSIYL